MLRLRHKTEERDVQFEKHLFSFGEISSIPFLNKDMKNLVIYYVSWDAVVLVDKTMQYRLIRNINEMMRKLHRNLVIN